MELDPLAVGRVRVFGAGGLLIGEREIAVGGGKKLGLLTVLALADGRSVHADRLVAGLWSDAEPTDAVRSLRVHISQLRKVLDDVVPGGRRLLEGRYPLYRLTPEVTSDLAEARLLHRRGLAAIDLDPEQALALLEAASELVSADPLPAIRHLPFASSVLAELDGVRVAIQDDHAELLVAVRGPEEALARVRELASAEPLRERRWLLLARTLAESGARDRALAALEEHGRHLRSALGAGPSARIDALRARIGNGSADGRPSSLRPRPRPPSALPDGLVQHLPAGWVGRERELAVLREERATFLVDRTLRCVEIVGRGGIGKSALLAKFAEESLRYAFDVRYLAWSRSAGSSLRPLVSAQLLDLNEVAGGSAPAGVVDAVRRAASRAPVLLLVDDYHWAAGSALDALAAIGAEGDLPVLALIARRPEPRGGPWPAADGPRSRLELDPLQQGDIDQVLGAAVLQDEERGFLGRSPRTFPGLLALDSTHRRAQITATLEHLDDVETRIVSLLALDPDGLALAVIAAVLDGPALDVLHRLHQLESDGLVVESDQGGARFALCHELVASTILERLGGAGRTALSASLHDALVAAGAGPSERVRHALAAEAALGTSAAETVADCIDELLAAGLHRDVVELAASAQHALGGLPPVARLRVDAAVVYARAALGEWPAAQSDLLELSIAAADREDWDGVARALSLRSRLGHEFSEDLRERKVLTLALRGIDEAEPLLRFELIDLVFSAKLHAGEPLSALDPLATEALQLSQSLRLPNQQARASLMEHQILSLRGAPPHRWLEVSRRTLSHARAAKDESLEMRARVDLAVDHLSTHDLARAHREIDVLAQANDPHSRWAGLLGRAGAALDAGEMAQGADLSEAAARFGEQHGVIGTFDALASQQLLVRWVNGTLGTMLDVMASVDWREPSRSVWGASLALGLIQDGQLDRAQELLDELLSDGGPAGQAGWMEIMTWAVLAEGAVLMEAPEAAQRCAGALRRWAGGRVLFGLAGDLGPVDRYLGSCLAVMGDRDAGRQLLDQAARDAHCELWAARAALDRGRLDASTIEIASGAPWGWLAAWRSAAPDRS